MNFEEKAIKILSNISGAIERHPIKGTLKIRFKEEPQPALAAALKEAYELGRSEAKARIEELEQCLRFYAEEEYWCACAPQDTAETCAHFIGEASGGKRARTALAKRGKGTV
jgi:hypothetical protein